jgi:hypothetical protein
MLVSQTNDSPGDIHPWGEIADNPFMLALSIRQPFAELILRGIKTVEYRTRPTRVIGRRFYIYAARKPASLGQQGAVWSNDLSGMTDPPSWLLELAEQMGMIEADAVLPSGVIVGSAVIERVSPAQAPKGEMWQWHLADVRRAKTFRKPRRRPQPVWFDPF